MFEIEPDGSAQSPDRIPQDLLDEYQAEAYEQVRWNEFAERPEPARPARRRFGRVGGRWRRRTERTES